MDLHPNTTNIPIAKLDHDLLWKIFSINADVDRPILSWYRYIVFDPRLSPLTIARHSSQVCSFWRSIMLESPSIWGNCLDLDLLSQDNDYWRREVLRRTGTALLSVRAQRPLLDYPPMDMLKFVIDIIHDHWTRIKLLDIIIDSNVILNDARVCNALCRPAQSMEVFSIRNENLRSRNDSGFNFPPNSQLFANNAPLLTHFSIGGPVLPFYNLVPIPAILRTSLLRHLTLYPFLGLSALHLLDACAQMPVLEELRINIAYLILEAPDSISASSSSLQTVSLPELRSISIISFCLDIYPEFLTRIIPRPGCRLDITVNIVPHTPEATATRLAVYAEEIQYNIVRFISGFFDNHVTGPHPTYLEFTLCLNRFGFSAYHMQEPEKTFFEDLYFHIGFEGWIIPWAIRELVARTLLSCNYPAYFNHLRFLPPQDDSISYIPSFTPIFLALRSVKELRTNIRGLCYIYELLVSENTFLRSLKAIFLLDIESLENTRQIVKSFFAHRQRTSPIKVLDLTEAEPVRFLVDLRFLDKIPGLKVIWKPYISDSKTMEYVCGSGKPARLILSIKWP